MASIDDCFKYKFTKMAAIAMKTAKIRKNSNWSKLSGIQL